MRTSARIGGGWGGPSTGFLRRAQDERLLGLAVLRRAQDDGVGARDERVWGFWRSFDGLRTNGWGFGTNGFWILAVLRRAQDERLGVRDERLLAVFGAQDERVWGSGWRSFDGLRTNGIGARDERLGGSGGPSTGSGRTAGGSGRTGLGLGTNGFGARAGVLRRAQDERCWGPGGPSTGSGRTAGGVLAVLRQASFDGLPSTGSGRTGLGLGRGSFDGLGTNDVGARGVLRRAQDERCWGSGVLRQAQDERCWGSGGRRASTRTGLELGRSFDRLRTNELGAQDERVWGSGRTVLGFDGRL